MEFKRCYYIIRCRASFINIFGQYHKNNYNNYQFVCCRRVCCKYNQSVHIGEKLFPMHFELLKMAYYSPINCAFSVLHACGLLTAPTPLACIDATVHARVWSLFCVKNQNLIYNVKFNGIGQYQL